MNWELLANWIPITYSMPRVQTCCDVWAARRKPSKLTTARLRSPQTPSSDGIFVGGSQNLEQLRKYARAFALSSRLRRRFLTAADQFTAFFTSAAIFASSAGVSSFTAKATGHMAPSSSFASCMKPNVAYRVLNLSALWKKQTILPSLV